MNRTRALTDLVDTYKSRGFQADQIVLSGHSAGGYASILVQMHNPKLVGKVIAFGPAFAGKRNSRGGGEAEVHKTFKENIANAKGLNVLTWVYDDDEYNRPVDLSGWKSNPGIKMIEVNGYQIDGRSCNVPKAHHIVFDSCFTSTQLNELLNFISDESRTRQNVGS